MSNGSAVSPGNVSGVSCSLRMPAVGGVQHRVVRRFDVSAGLQPFAELAVFEQQYPAARPTDDHAAGGDMAGEVFAVVQRFPVEPGDEFRERPGFGFFFGKMPEIAFL